MHQIKDQERLFSKLFMAPSASNNDLQLILSMQFLKLLLEQVHLLAALPQKHLMLKILNLFVRQPLNSLLLYQHDHLTHNETPLLTLIIKGLSNITTKHNENEMEQIMSSIDKLLSYYQIGLIHISFVTKELAKQFQFGTFHNLKARFYHLLLQKYYKKKDGLCSMPPHFFFFYGKNQNSAIRPIKPLYKIKNEMSIALSFNILSIDTEGTLILSMTTDHEIITVRVGKFITVHNKTTGQKYQEQEYIQINKWYHLIINLSSQSTCVFLNRQQISKSKPILKKQKQRQIRQLSIGQQMIGFIGAIIISDKMISTQKINDLPDFQSLRNIRYLIQSKMYTNIIFSCLPYLKFQMNNTIFCFDLFRKAHSMITQNTFIFNNRENGLGISFLGGYQILLPLFYLARFYNHQEYPDHLENLLKILLAAVEHFQDKQNKEEFLLILGNLLQPLHSLFNQACVQILTSIEERLTKNKISFLKHVGWSGLPGRSSGKGVQCWLNWLTKLYQSNKSYGLRAYGLMDVVFWLVKYIENRNQQCCPKHYLSQARVLREFSLDEFRQIESSTKKWHFEAVQNIATMILSYLIIQNRTQAIKQIKSVLRLLLHKYSNCLYLTILRILKRQFLKFDDHKMISTILLDANIIPYLAATLQKIVDPTTMTQIIYLMLIISQHQKEDNIQSINFIDLILKRMHSIGCQRFNFLSHGAKKVRKSSTNSIVIRKEPLNELFNRISTYKQTFQTLKILILNVCCGIVSQEQLPVLNSFLQFQPGFRLLKSLLLIGGSKIRLQVGQWLLLKLFQGQSNIQFCQKSIYFNQILLDIISLGKQTQLKIIQQILSKIFKSQLQRNINIGDYYILIKNISKSQIIINNIIIHTFLNIITKENKLNIRQLYQILLIVNHQRNKGSEGMELNEWKELVCYLCGEICNKIKKRGLIESQQLRQGRWLDIINKLKKISSQERQQTWLQLHLINNSNQLVQFLFDSILPKIIINNPISSLLKDFNRQIYLYQILIYNLISTIEYHPQLLTILIESIIIFTLEGMIGRQEQINKSFIRMMIFIISHYLIVRHEIQLVITLWDCFISIIQEQGVKFKANSYTQLNEKMKENQLQPFIVQIFQVFLRNINETYIVTFQEMMLANNKKLRQEMIRDKLLSIFSLQQLGNVWDVCQKFAMNKISQQYQLKIKENQYKFDMMPKIQHNNNVIFQSVVKIFQQESIGQEETRLQYLQQHETLVRKYHQSWNYLWRKLRLYHHPYGMFIAQKNHPNNFLFSDYKNKNYRFKMSKYSTKSGIYPILEAEIEQPWHVKKNAKLQKKKEIGNLAELIRPSQAYRKKNEGMIDSIVKFMRKLQRTKSETSGDYEVVWVKRGNKARGKVMINDNNQLIFWYQSLKQEDSHLSFQAFQLPVHKQMVKSWSLHTFKQVARRRYLMKYNALQITLNSQTSLLFHFQNNKQDQFLLQLSQIRASIIEEYGHKLKLNRVPFYSEQWFSDDLSHKIIEEWKSKKITNLEYLIKVNRAASRNIYDISQYPVFPWVCYMNEDKQPTMRDLTKTIGFLGSQQRKKVVIQKYNAADPFNPVPPFYFGTHYSSPGVVFNYLIRLAPFTDYSKSLQGGKFDIADRLFSSFLTAWKSTFNEVSDVRQLIPEFYYIPECFINLQKLRLGITQSGEIINEVQLPGWAANNPYFFTMQLRQMLQSQEVSLHLGDWIDLIFGFKQRGQQAKKNFNIYYYLTYEDYSNCLDDRNDEVYRKSCEAQIVHFGQIPPQLLQKQHPKPNKQYLSSHQPVELTIKRRIILINNIKQQIVIGLHVYNTSSQLIILKRDKIQILTTLKIPSTIIKIIPFNFQKTISSKLYCIKKQHAKVIFFNINKNYFLIYGYITNQFRIFNKITGEIQYDYSVDSKIQHAIINQEESLIILGCLSGMLYVFQIQYGNGGGGSKLIVAKQIYREMFMHSISHISEQDGFFAISFGCFVSIYKIQRSLHYLGKVQASPFIKFFRTFQNNILIRASFIADNPLYCILIIDNANIKIYSINGQFIKSISCNAKYFYHIRDKNLNWLLCLVQQGRVMLLSTPDLRGICQIQLQVGGKWHSKMIVYQRQILQIGLR